MYFVRSVGGSAEIHGTALACVDLVCTTHAEPHHSCEWEREMQRIWAPFEPLGLGSAKQQTRQRVANLGPLGHGCCQFSPHASFWRHASTSSPVPGGLYTHASKFHSNISTSPRRTLLTAILERFRPRNRQMYAMSG